MQRFLNQQSARDGSMRYPRGGRDACAADVSGAARPSGARLTERDARWERS